MLMNDLISVPSKMSLQGQLKKKTSDFRFGKCIGEGSFSEVGS